MFNVLPENLKEDITHAYMQRRLIVWLVLAIGLGLMFFIGLMPAYVTLVFQEKDLSSQTNTIATTTTSGPDVSAIVTDNNHVLSAVSTRLSDGSLAKTLSRIVSLTGSNVALNEIMYTRNTDPASANASLTLEGVASTREALLAFQKRLEADPALSDVNLPVSDFAKSSSLKFSVTVNEAQ